MQQTLAKTVTDAITQNREFGALLQIELRALQQANGDKEVEQLRQILVGGLEELIQGQNSLEAKLHKTGGYLRLIKADSERLHEELNKVRLLSLTDEFTGLPNRRAFMRRLQDEISRSQRYGASLALAIIDLDEFKAINDIHGHATGDAILRCYATDVLTVLRHHDLVARYGGEEFAILMPNTTREGAVAAIEKVRNRALQVRVRIPGPGLQAAHVFHRHRPVRGRRVPHRPDRPRRPCPVPRQAPGPQPHRTGAGAAGGDPAPGQKQRQRRLNPAAAAGCEPDTGD